MAPYAANANGNAHRHEELTVSRFCIDIGGLLVASFRECSGLSGEIEVESLAEGGLNGYEHKLPGRAKFGNVSFRSGIVSTLDMWEWFYNAVTGKIERKDISVVMFLQTYTEAMRWNLAAAFPVRWEGPSFTAGEASVAVHSIELAHNGITLSAK